VLGSHQGAHSAPGEPEFLPYRGGAPPSPHFHLRWGADRFRGGEAVLGGGAVGGGRVYHHRAAAAPYLVPPLQDRVPPRPVGYLLY